MVRIVVMVVAVVVVGGTVVDIVVVVGDVVAPNLYALPLPLDCMPCKKEASRTPKSPK